MNESGETGAVRGAWLRLALAQGSGRAWARALVARTGSALQAARADAALLRRALGAARARERARALRTARPQQILAQAEALEQRVLTPADREWPGSAFENLADAPCALFLQGRLPAPGSPAAALVGTRDASAYGLRVAGTLAAELAATGIWIVSGFALGIDGAAHEAAVDVGGATLAVLGCGLDHDYPVAHGDLRVQMLERGGLLSEHPPGTEPRRHHFPRRNRLVAALAQVTVVVEAPVRSGALITARMALELGRDVLAVPGSIFRENLAGCHRLLREGAGLCGGSADVRLALGLSAEGSGPPGGRPRPPEDVHEAAVWRALDDEVARDANALCQQTGLGAEALAIALAGLELSGHARRLPGVGFVRA